LGIDPARSVHRSVGVGLGRRRAVRVGDGVCADHAAGRVRREQSREASVVESWFGRRHGRAGRCQGAQRRRLDVYRWIRRFGPLLKNAISSFSSRIVVDLSEAKVYTYWGEWLLATYPVAVGQPGWETPIGTFKVRQKLRNPVWQEPITGELIRTGPDNPLGNRWIGFWSDGRHQIGFHGTNKEQLVGQRVSHGCLRMRNTDIHALYEQVVIGTPVVVRK